tara:strand:- start:6406 stop:6633 length:228 start_codon:yes stop_codon:yes gene_type:complete
MRKKIHPEYSRKKFICSCGNICEVGSAYEKGSEIHINVCSACHPFYTGTKRHVDATGRVEKFRRKQELSKNRSAK